MAHDEDLAGRIRLSLAETPGVSERQMFGGLAFLIDGNMALAVSADGTLLLRVDPARSDALTQHPGVARAMMRGRELGGWLRVDPCGDFSEVDLRHWVGIGADYAGGLPPKTTGTAGRRGPS